MDEGGSHLIGCRERIDIALHGLESLRDSLGIPLGSEADDRDMDRPLRVRGSAQLGAELPRRDRAGVILVPAVGEEDNVIRNPIPVSLLRLPVGGEEGVVQACPGVPGIECVGGAGQPVPLRVIERSARQERSRPWESADGH